MRHLSCSAVCVLSFLLIAFLPGTRSCAGEPAYPRLANYYLHGYVDPTAIPELAKWDLVILKTVWTEQQLASLRALNPDIRIYLYLCAYALEVPSNPADPWNRTLVDYANDYDFWWYDTQGRVASDWPGSQMVNVLSSRVQGPVGGDWLRFFEAVVRELVNQRPDIDGIFLDNFWKRLSWNQDQLQLDSDCHPSHNPAGCDGVPDVKSTLDARWNAAMRQLAANLRASFDRASAGRSRPLSLITNSSTDYFESLNGTLYEFFPGGSPPDYGSRHNYAWREAMFQWPGGYRVAPFRRQPYQASVINASWRGTPRTPQRSGDFERHKRFTFGSTLLADGYYSLDGGLQGHGHLWWEPEFDHDGRGKGYLGQPLGPVYSLPTAPGPEVIVNGDFARDLESWDLRMDRVAGSNQVVHYGQGSYLQLVVQGLQHPSGAALLSQSGITLRHDEAWTVRLMAHALTPVTLELSLTSPQCPDDRCMRTWNFRLDSEPREFAVSFVSPASASATLTLALRQPGMVQLGSLSVRSGSIDVYRRDFDNGTVIVNYTNQPRMVSLGQPLQRLQVTGSSVFDGRQVSMDWVGPGDAVVYVRPAAASAKAAPVDAVGSPLHLVTDRSGTTVHFSLMQPERVRLRVFDARGRLVQELQPPASLAAGAHTLLWGHDDRQQRTVGRGVYFVRFDTTLGSQHRKVVVTR